MHIRFSFDPETSRDDVFDLVEGTHAAIDDVDHRECTRATDAQAEQCVQAIYNRNPVLAITLIQQTPMLVFDSRVAYAMYSNLSVLQAMFSQNLMALLPTYDALEMPNGNSQPIQHDVVLGLAQKMIGHSEYKSAKHACQEICNTHDYSGNVVDEITKILEEEHLSLTSHMTISYLCYYLANAFLKQEHFFYTVTFNVFTPIFIRDVLYAELKTIKAASDYLYPRQLEAFYQIRNQFRNAHVKQKNISYQHFPILSRSVANFVDFGLNKDLRLLNHVNVLEAPTGYGKTRTAMVAALGDFVDAHAFDVPQRHMIVGTRTRSQVRAFLKESQALQLSALGVPSKTLSCSLRSKVIIPENPYWKAFLRLSKDNVDADTQKMLFDIPSGNNAKVRDELIDTFAGSDICKTCVFNPKSRKGFVPEDHKAHQTLTQALATGTLPGGLRIELTQEAIDLMMGWYAKGLHHFVLSYLQAIYLDLDTAAEAFMIIFGKCGYRVAVSNLTQFKVLIVTYPYLFDPQISKYFRTWCQTDRVVTSHAVVIDEAHGLDKISSDETAVNPNLLAKCFYYNEWIFHVQGLLGHKRSPLQRLFDFKYDAQEIADIISQTALGYLQILRYLEDSRHDIGKDPLPKVRMYFPSAEVIYERLSLFMKRIEEATYLLRDLSTRSKENVHHGALAGMDLISNNVTNFLQRYMNQNIDFADLMTAADHMIEECYPSGLPAYSHRNFTSAKELFAFLTDLNDALRNDMIKSERYKDLSMSDIKMLGFTFNKISSVFDTLMLFYQYLIRAEGAPDNWIILVADRNGDWSFKKPYGKKLVRHLKRDVYGHEDRFEYHEAHTQAGFPGTPFTLSAPGQKYTTPAITKMLQNPDKIGNKFDDADKDGRYDWTYVPYRLSYPKMTHTFLQHDAKAWKKMTGIRMELISNAAVLNAGFLGYNAVYLLSGTMPDDAYLKHFMGLHSHRTAVSKPLGKMTFITGSGATTKYNERDQHYERYAHAILDIYCQRRLERPDRHVMVVFSSGAMLLEIYQRCMQVMAERGLSRQELITEKDHFYAKDRRLLEYGITAKYPEHNYMTINFFTDYLRQHRANNNSILTFVVAGGRYSEGIEFTYEGRTMIGTAITIGIPIPPPTPKMTALTEVLQEQGLGKWEIFELSSLQNAFQKIRQAVGRTNRNDKDESEIFLLDSRYVNQSYWTRKFPADKVIDITERRPPEEIHCVSDVPYLKEDDIPF